MKKLLTALLSIAWLAPTPGHARGLEALTDLTQALEQAQKEKKMLFVQYGREACGNCQALKGYIRNGEVRLSRMAFVYVDLNCDDAKVRQLFRQKFKVEGTTLPFVVIASADGEQLTSRSGFGTAEDFENLIKRARKKDKK